MKIAIYTHFLSIGGAEKRASVYANFLYENGVDVVVITSHPKDGEYPINPNIKRIYLCDSYKNYSSIPKKKRIKLLRDIIEEEQITTIVCFLTTYSMYAVLATKFYKPLKKVKVIHSLTLYQRKLPFFERCIDFFCCLYSDNISLQCKEQMKANRLFKRKCNVNYNPIKDVWGKEVVRDYTNLSIISAGRLTKQKNFSFLIKCVLALHKINSNVSLDIYGDGPLKEKLQHLINKNNATSYIKIYPFSLNIADELYKRNVMVCSSRYEGFPNVLVEGMMSGLVCLSTPCPTGPKEIIDNGNNGFVFKNKKGFLNIAQNLLKDKELCKKISFISRKSAKERFEDKVVLPTFLENVSSSISTKKN